MAVKHKHWHEVATQRRRAAEARQRQGRASTQWGAVLQRLHEGVTRASQRDAAYQSCLGSDPADTLIRFREYVWPLFEQHGSDTEDSLFKVFRDVGLVTDDFFSRSRGRYEQRRVAVLVFKLVFVEKFFDFLPALMRKFEEDQQEEGLSLCAFLVSKGLSAFQRTKNDGS